MLRHAEVSGQSQGRPSTCSRRAILESLSSPLSLYSSDQTPSTATRPCVGIAQAPRSSRWRREVEWSAIRTTFGTCGRPLRTSCAGGFKIIAIALLRVAAQTVFNATLSAAARRILALATMFWHMNPTLPRTVSHDRSRHSVLLR